MPNNQLEWMKKKNQSSLVVSLIGRPNVGKSSLFNCILQKNHKNRGPLTFDMPGVTRDFHYGHLVLDELRDQDAVSLMLVDTGGFFPDEKNTHCLLTSIEQHAKLAIEESDLLLLVVDIRAGLLAIDLQLAKMIQLSKKPFIVLVNKTDDPKLEGLEADFFALGVDSHQIFLTSSAHAKGISAVRDYLQEYVLENGKDASVEEIDLDTESIELTLIGTPNSGKSTLMNQLLGYNRSLVTPIAGTTMDPVEDEFFIDIPAKTHPLRPELTRMKVQIRDTAGIRRLKAIESTLESLSVFRSLKAIDQAQVVLLLIDCIKGITHQDRRLAQVALEKGCAVIVLLNKIDLATKETNIIKIDPGLAPYVQILPISAQTGYNVEVLKKSISKTYLARLRPFRPQVVLEYLQKLTTVKPYYPTRSTRNPLKIKYANLVKQHPPTFLVFSNHTENIAQPYKRYLTNGLRNYLRVPNSPIHLIFRRNEESKSSYR